MKKLSLFLVVTLISGAIFAEGYKIKGTVTDLKTGKARLKILQNDGSMKLDSANIKNGTFEFMGQVDGPCPAIVSVQANPSGAVFYLENSIIEISTKSIAQKKANPYSSTVIGSKSNDAYERMVGHCDTLPAGKKTICFLDLVKENLTSLYTPFIIVQNNLASIFTYDELCYIMDGMSPEAKNSFVYKTVLQPRRSALEKVSVGKTAPEFELPDREGNMVSYNDLLKNSKYVLIDFWASWCGPCRKENPNVVRAYETYHDKGFDILGVSYDTDRSRWEKAIEDDKLTWSHVSDLKGWKGMTPGLYAISGIPANVLIDQNGTIIGRDLKGKDLQEKLKELLGE